MRYRRRCKISHKNVTKLKEESIIPPFPKITVAGKLE
jgi:hypothetical protein